jgi:hypothetical protein
MLLGLGKTAAGQILQTMQDRSFDCHKTLAALTHSCLHCPAENDHLLETYLDYLTRNGLLSQEQIKK